MNLNSRTGPVIARITALGVGLLGSYILIINTTDVLRGDSGYAWSALTVILAFGLMSTVGGLLMLLSLDGPERFRGDQVRKTAALLMAGGSALPHSLMALVLLPSAVVLIMAFATTQHDTERPITSE